jgi:YjbE family integral membrane protein
MNYDHPAFWLAIGQIIWINVLLSGDNAVVIALACRSLAGRARWWGMVMGSAVAVILRILFTGIITTLMDIPYLKIAGAAALIFIAVDLVRPKPHDEDIAVNAADTLLRAIVTIVIADLVMSLDNIIAIAAVARGSWTHLIIGLAISIPMIISGSIIIVKILDRLPILIWAGAGLLGWIAGDMVAGDVAAIGLLGIEAAHTYEIPAALAGMVIVIALSLWLTYGRDLTARHEPPQ